ncbi:hypothetical protein [Bombilactobacillus mellis]|nr:hypothetical protein [Bombilactobacillus mellis]
MLGLSVFIFANKTLAADKQNTNNNTTVSENTINPIKATSVASLQSGKSNTVVKNTPNMPIFPVSQKLVKSGVTDPYLNAYTNYDNGEVLPIEKQDLIMESDGNGGYIAHIYNTKGFFEAIFDPANPAFPMNSKDPNGWASYHNGALYSNLNVTPRPLSKIHKIVFENNIDMDVVDSDTALNYEINTVRPDLMSGSAAKTGKGNDSINSNNNHRGGYGNYNYIYTRHDKLTIDGQNKYWLNSGYNNIALNGTANNSNPYKEDWTLENMDTYGTSYYGIVSANVGKASNYLRARANPGDKDPDDNTKTLTQSDIDTAKAGGNGGYTWLTFKNMTYTGSQLSWTSGSRVAGTTILGNVTCRSLFSYTEPGINSNYLWQTDSSGNQQIFQVDRIIFGKDSHFTGATYNANAIELSGSASLEPGAKVDLYPHGNAGIGSGPEDVDMSLGWGFQFYSNSNPSLDLYGDSQLNIHCDNHDGNDLITPSKDGSSATWQPGVTIAQEQAAGIGTNASHQISPSTAGALDMEGSKSSITYHETTEVTDGTKKILSPEINIEGKGPIYGNHPLVNFGGGNAQLSHGKFSIKATNLNNQEDVNNNNKIIHYTNNSSSGTGGLMAVTGSNTRIEVKTGGDFSISASNHKDDDVTGSPVNLLYLGSGALINLMNPKNVSLDLRNNNDPDSALVYAYGNQSKIYAYDTRVQAWGDNKLDGNGNGVNQTENNSKIAGYVPSGIDYKYNQIISLGMGDKSDPNNNGGKCTPDPIRAQTLTLPFNRYAIDFTQYLTQPAKNVIQGHKTDLDLLKAAMVQMNGREFRYVRLSDLPGPTVDDVDKVCVPGTDITQRNITGKVGGDYWANDDESDKTLFSPVPPLLRVQLKQKDSKSPVDLGTEPNSNAAQEKTNTDPQDTRVTEVTPNPIDSNRNVRTDTDGNYMIGTKVTTDGDTINPQPKYLDPKIVTWDKNGWSKDTSSSENDPQHSFSYNLQDVINKYNDNHTDKKISLQPGDQVLTSVVTNYQETPVQNTRFTNLYLKKGDEPKTPFLIGDKVTMPFQYIDTNTGAYKLFLSGTIYKLVNDDDGIITRKEVCTFNKQQVDRKQSNGWETNSLDLPTETTSKPGATSEPGNYVVEFYGTDDVGDSGNAGPDDPISWQYTVSNLPKYNGKKVLNDHTTGDTTKPGNIVSNLHYTVKTVFEAVNTTNGTLSTVMFNHPDTIGDGIDNSDTNIEENSDYTLTASYSDNKGQITNKQLESDFKYKTDYIPKQFGINQGTFPKGVKFTITYKILVKKKAKDDLDKLVKIGADQMYSKEGDNKVGTLLSTSNSIGYNSIGSIVLNVSGGINYGTSALPLNKQKTLFMKKQYPIVKIENDTSASQPITLTAQVDGDTSGLNSLNNWLYYRKTKNNDDSDTLMTNKVTVFHDSVGTNVSQNISSSWFNNDGKQVTGPILKLGQNSSPTPGTQYNTKITWNLTNSL